MNQTKVKKSKKIENKQIYIPHIHYKIEVSFKSKEFLNNLGMECACEYIKNGQIKLHFRNKPVAHDFPSLAHEILHAIQWISKDRGIDMIKEEEHCAYMMQFILNEILNYEYQLKK
jgi:hypothetical protein